MLYMRGLAGDKRNTYINVQDAIIKREVPNVNEASLLP